MKVAVTGAAGYLGSNLTELLVEQGHEVVAIDRMNAEHWPDSVTFVEGDVLDQAGMTAALEGVEVLYHLVAMITLKQQDSVAWRLNTEGVRTVARAARAAGVRRMVHASSVHSFDQYDCDGRIDEDSPRSVGEGLPVYDRSKWAGEIALREVIAEGLDAVICNPTGVYGPVDHALSGLSRLNGILRDAARGRVPASIQGGYDLVDVRDVALGLTLAAEKGRTGENYLLTGHPMEITAAMKIAAKATGRRGPAFAIPTGVVEKILPIAEPIAARFGSDVMSRAAMGALLSNPYVDGTKARTELGYSPRPAEETIKDLVTFYLQTDQL